MKQLVVKAIIALLVVYLFINNKLNEGKKCIKLLTFQLYHPQINT